MKHYFRLAALAALAVVFTSPVMGDWLSVGGDRARTSTADRGPHTLDHVRWSAAPEADEAYVAQSTPVVAGLRVFVNARVFESNVQVGNRLIAYALDDGERLWDADIDADEYQSWSSPAIDVRNGSVLLCSGDTIYAFDQATGNLLWQRTLHRFVNASLVVTADLFDEGTPANRAFITDYSVGSSGKLYAINVDPNDPADNPYAPGAVVWQTTLGKTHGATPAYADGKVYVANGAGKVTAIDALDPPRDPNAGGEAIPDWSVTVPVSNPSEGSGFFGGIVAVDDALCVASYNFVGGANSADLFKLDASDGGIRWHADSERTDSMPVVDVSGTVFLAGGIDDFGSRITLQAFAGRDPNGVALWETADASTLPRMGGWTHQPAIAEGRLYVGSPGAVDPNAPFGEFDAYRDLYILDASRDPNDPQFVVDHFAGAGGSPAISHRRLVSIGRDGLFTFDPTPACAADLDLDGVVNLTDLGMLLSAMGKSPGQPGYLADADLNLDGLTNLTDLGLLLAAYGETCD